MNLKIRILTQEDWQAWKAIRLEALRLHPEYFGAAYEDERQNSEDVFKQVVMR